MYWRPISESDLSKCLEIQPACLGDQIVGRSAALRVWKSLLDNPSFQANVIESERPLAGHKIVGCGMGVFVTEAFADREIRNPRPGLNSRLIAEIASGESVVLNRAQIGQGNAGEGIDFVNMYGTWRDGIMNSDQLSEVHPKDVLDQAVKDRVRAHQKRPESEQHGNDLGACRGDFAQDIAIERQ